MDKEAAKFVLQSFRPDGADASDADFAEALQLASSDRELGEWLMRERAFDAEFAAALERVTLPNGLRDSVLQAMSHDLALLPDAINDQFMFDEMSNIPIPSALCERVVEAMEQTAKKNRPSSQWWRFALPLAAAAGIAVAFFLGGEYSTKLTNIDNGKITISAVQAGFVSAIESPEFHLDQKEDKTKHLLAHLRKSGLPCGKGHVPPGLVGVKGLGCCELNIDGKRGSLLCFDCECGTMHLVIFKRNDVSGNLPEVENPNINESGKWATASWQEDGYAFTLLGTRSPSSLAEFF